MASTLIRQAGPYTVETDGRSILVNGKVAPLRPASGNLLFLADTGEVGANGKPNMVGLTAEHYAIHVKVRDAAQDPAIATAQAEYVSTQAQRQAAERAWDLGHNEGGEGYNPHRIGSEPTYNRLPRRDRRYPEGA